MLSASCQRRGRAAGASLAPPRHRGAAGLDLGGFMDVSMGAEELRESQGPLKQRYREDPGAAQITLEADGELDEGVTCSVKTGRALVQAGLHPGTGGDGSSACSGDMLL